MPALASACLLRTGEGSRGVVGLEPFRALRELIWCALAPGRKAGGESADFTAVLAFFDSPGTSIFNFLPNMGSQQVATGGLYGTNDGYRYGRTCRK